MRRDSIFYRIFKQSPALLFELLDIPPPNAADYKFDSVKFEQMSRAEVEAMLDLTLQETRVYQEAKAEGREEGREEGEKIGEQRGRQQEAVRLVLKLLTRRLNQALSTEVRSQIETLPLAQLEALTETLLDFTRLEDLLTWLEGNQLSEAGGVACAEHVSSAQSDPEDLLKRSA